MTPRRFLQFLSVVVYALCLAVSAGHAQILAQVSDSTCTVWNGTECTGTAGQGCKQTLFTLETAQTVRLCESLTCENGQNCPYCLSVGYIYPVAGSNIVCYHSACDANCMQVCNNVSLPAGDYVLYSCKLDCGVDDCQNCPSSCIATATVYSFP